MAVLAALAIGTATAADKVSMGFIYVGPKDDYGYNQAHSEGCAGVQKLDWVSAVEEASVPETTAVEEAMRDMIEQNKATVLFPTSFGYFNPHILKLAKDYPKVQFFHCGGMWHDGLPDNVGSYFGYIDEAEYVAGIVAAESSKSKKLGFIAAKPIPQVLRNINSYTLGARSVVPAVTVQVIFTGDWSLPVKEAEASNSLIDQGVDVLTCHVDSPKVIVDHRRKTRHHVYRLPRQSIRARTQRLPHRRGMELVQGVYGLRRLGPLRQIPHGRHHSPSDSRRAEGRVLQSFPLRSAGQ